MGKLRSYSLGDRLAATRFHPSGFDYMRVLLALSIVLLHSRITGEGLKADVLLFQGPMRPFLRLVLPMFFALSGFLVAGSLERTKTLGMFLALRAIRIYPALMVEVILSAFILGPWVTTLPLNTYFSDPLFRQYLLNVIGDVHFALPGVFQNNPLPGIVNGQLWTIPFELYCYLTIAAATVAGLKKYRALGPIFVVVVTLLYLGVTLYRHNGEIVPVPGAINGALLIATFLAGVSIYFYRAELPWNPVVGLVAIVTSGLLLGGYVPYGDFFAPVPAAYATVYLGLLNPSRKSLRGADYSYGIYLYGFAIQQTLVDVIPAARHWYFNILMSVPLTVAVAAASWHFVELPAHKLRPWLYALEDSYLRFSSRWKKSAPRAA
jgi:peptidoglycan/LPS O-acetylase OafA/YrhL